MEPRVVILAAGSSTRMGAQKLLMPYRGRPMIEYALEASRMWNPLVVASPDLARALPPKTLVVVNREPQLGMAHSLKLAHATIPADAPIIIVLADKPLVTAKLIQDTYAALQSEDVAYPVRASDGSPGHPVVFSSRARAKIPALADGDTLRMLRDDPTLTRRTFVTGDRGAFFDVDTREMFDA